MHQDPSRMASSSFVDRMRGREIVQALSITELLSLCAWCILALIFKVVNMGFAGLDKVLGLRFDEVSAPSVSKASRTDVREGELAFQLGFRLHLADTLWLDLNTVVPSVL